MRNRPTHADPTPEAAVRAVESAYDAAWNAGDVESILRLLTDGVVITSPMGETTSGRLEAARFFAALFEGPAKGSRHSSQILAVRFVAPDVALVDGEATITGFGSAPEPLRHRFTDVLVRSEVGWRIDQVRAYVFMPRPGP